MGEKELSKLGITIEQYEQILDEIDAIQYGTSDKEWEDIVQEYNINISPVTLRKASQTAFGGTKRAEYLMEKALRNVDKSVLDEVRAERIEIEKLKIQYQDQKREYKAYLRQDARFEHLKQEMIKAIKENNDIFMDDYIDEGDEKYTCASLLLSDWHVGLMIDDELNTYNYKVMAERVAELRNKVIKYCKKNNVYQLNIELLGDMCQGYLHTTSRVFNEEDVVSQTMKVSSVLAEFINDLALYVPQIEVYSCVGNHGRCSANLKDSLQTENFERLITWHLQTKLNNSNVKVHDCSVDMIMYKNMNGHNIVAAHGNLDKPNQVVNNFVKMYRYIPEEFHLGHTHFYQENDEYDINVLVNGTLSGTDQFAKSIRKASMPCQVLRIYGDDVNTYKLKLW